MNKFLLVLIAIIIMFSNIDARIKKDYVTKEKIGQKYYLNRCHSCHGEGNRGGNLNSIQEWENAFKNNAKEMIQWHEGEDNTQNILIYLKSENMKKEQSRMIRFLQEFAYDSEVIPTCN